MIDYLIDLYDVNSRILTYCRPDWPDLFWNPVASAAILDEYMFFVPIIFALIELFT